MPVCQHCHKKWTYTDTLKNMFRFICPYCNNKNYLSVKARKRGGYIYVVILPFLILNLYYDISLFIVTMIALLLVITNFLIHPFMVQLSKEEEPLW